MMRACLLAACLAIPVAGFAGPGLAGAGPGAAEDYVLHCSGCHQQNGAGTRDIPSLHGLAPILESPAGRRYLGRVPGVAQAALDDARLARLLNWVLAEFSHAAPVPPYTPAEIGSLRRRPLRDTTAARARLHLER